MGSNRFRTKQFYLSLLVIVAAVIIAVAYYFSDGKYNRIHEVTRLEGDVILENGQPFQTDLVFDDSISFISTITARFTIYDRVNVGQMNIVVYEDDAAIQEFSINTYEIGIDGSLPLKLDSTLTIDPESHYTINMNYTYEGDNAVALQRIEVNSMESSRLQRALISIVVLVLGAVLAFCIFENNFPDSLSETKMVIIALPILVLYAFFFNHGDGFVITKWGIRFLDCAFSGDIRNYADIMLAENGVRYTPNYNILDILITAVTILPLYLVQYFTGFECDDIKQLIYYDEFRKISLILAVIITAKYIRKIVISLKGSTRAANTASLLYIISPALLYCNIGMGQIDCISVLFLSLFFYEYINDKKCHAMLFLSISMLIKSFPLLLVMIPLVCISINKRRLPDIKSLTCLLTPWVISRILSSFVFVNYYKYSELAEREWDHVGGFLHITWAHSSLFMLVFVILCFVLLFSNKTREADCKKLLLISSLLVAGDLTFFVDDNPQWFVYALFIMIISIPLCHGIHKAVVSVVTYSLTGLVYTFSAFYEHVDLNMVYQSLIGNYYDFKIRSSYMLVFNHLMPNYVPYISIAAKTIMVCMVLLSLYWSYENRDSKQNVAANDQNKLLNLSTKGLIIFDVAFVLISLLLFFRIVLI